MDHGKVILGSQLRLTVQCTAAGVPTAPDSAPTLKVYTDTGTLVRSLTVPPQDQTNATGLFGYLLPLNSSYSTGKHFALWSWVISSTTYTRELDHFEIVAGGHADGMLNAMFYLDRPDGNDWILTTSEQGVQRVHRGPQVN